MVNKDISKQTAPKLISNPDSKTMAKAPRPMARLEGDFPKEHINMDEDTPKVVNIIIMHKGLEGDPLSLIKVPILEAWLPPPVERARERGIPLYPPTQGDLYP